MLSARLAGREIFLPGGSGEAPWPSGWRSSESVLFQERLGPSARRWSGSVGSSSGRWARRLPPRRSRRPTGRRYLVKAGSGDPRRIRVSGAPGRHGREVRPALRGRAKRSHGPSSSITCRGHAGDELPSDVRGVLVSLADKVDTDRRVASASASSRRARRPILRLRRQALGILRILLAHRPAIHLGTRSCGPPPKNTRGDPDQREATCRAVLEFFAGSTADHASEKGAPPRSRRRGGSLSASTTLIAA